jgi:hypothetical protein
MDEIKIVNSPSKIDGIRVVQDYGEILEALKNGESVMHWESGNSLHPLIKNLEYCCIKPCKPIDVKRGDCVFCIIEDENNHELLPMVHQVWEISNASATNELWFKIGSTYASIFGWTKRVYGIAKGTNIFQKIDESFLLN